VLGLPIPPALVGRGPHPRQHDGYHGHL